MRQLSYQKKKESALDYVHQRLLVSNVLLISFHLTACTGDPPSNRTNVDAGGLDAGSGTPDGSTQDARVAPVLTCGESARLRAQSFATDPEWDGLRNREAHACPTTRQDFGYSDTNYAGTGGGEIGGFFSRSASHAHYARAVEARTLGDRLHARGRLSLREAEEGGVLIGWFNENTTGWRGNNTLALRIDGKHGSANVLSDYATRLFSAGGGSVVQGVEPDGQAHLWEISYDPDANDGNGRIRFLWDGAEVFVDISPEHRAAGAEFNRFGLLSQQIPGGTMELYVDDLVIDDVEQHFADDPQWEGVGNRRTFEDCEWRPWHNYGYTPVVGEEENGQLGGVIWRTEPTQPDTFTYYADRVGPLTSEDELCVEGFVTMMRASSDSAAMLGWFSSADEGRLTERFVGALIEGPSRAGHWFRPYALGTGEQDGPIILADGERHPFVMRYRRTTGGAEIEYAFDGGEQRTYAVHGDPALLGNALDRFGMFNLQPGGHYMEVYFDDLRYTAEPPAP